MALQVGELYASLSIDSTGFDKEMGGLEKKMGGLGSMLATGLVGAVAGALVAVGGAIVAAVAGADNFQKSLNSLQMQTGATSEEMAGMEESLKNIYNNNYGDSFQDIADSMALVKQTTGATGPELEALTQNALMLRDAFGYEVSESVRGADQMMKQFGVSGDEAMAMIAEATQKGLNKSGDLIDTIEEYSVYFEGAGMSAQDMFAVMENAGKAGVRNFDLVGDAVKEFGIIMKEDSTRASDALNQMGLDGEALVRQFAQGGEGARTAFETITQALGTIEDPLQRNAVGVELFGTKFEDLEADAVIAMGNLNGTIQGSADTLNQLNEINFATFSEAMSGIGRQLQTGLLMPIGEMLLPYLNEFANWVASKLPSILSFFENFGAGASGVFSAIGNVVGPVMDFIGQKVTEVVTMIVEWWNKNGKELQSNFETVFNAIMTVVDFVMPAIEMLIGSVMNNIKGVISGALNIISGLFKTFAGLLTGDWSKMWDGIKQLVSGALEFVWNLINLILLGKVIAGIKTFASGMLTNFTTMWTTVRTTFDDFTAAIYTNISTWFTNLVTRIVTFVTNAIAKFKGFQTQTKTIFEAVKKAVTDIITKMWTALKTKVDEIVNGFITAFNILKDTLAGIWDGIVGMIKGRINSIISAINTFIRGMNKISFDAPDWVPGIGGKSFGINIPEIPMLAKGGIVTRPTLAMIGEGNESEAVLPLSKLNALIGSGGGGGDVYVTVTSDELHKVAQAVQTMEELRQKFRKK